MRTLEVVVGAQFGSEAKGHVVQRLTERAQRASRAVHVVRVAGPNAGHTGYDAHGVGWALRQVPVAAVTVGPALLGIAAGSEIDPPVLLDEYDRLHEAGLFNNKSLWVSGEATLIEHQHKVREAGGAAFPGHAVENLIEKIGSTGKGIGAARADRLMRSAKRVLDNDKFMTELQMRGIGIGGTGASPVDATDRNGHVIIEGTQGYGLGLRAGHYPQCTSSDCRAIDFMAMAGVHPWEFAATSVVAVARMFPIRVAGNSGPLKGETTWEELGLPEERTTVTKKVRRVGQPDWELVADAVRANGGDPTVTLAVTMVDQMFPFMRDKTFIDSGITDAEYTKVRSYLGSIRTMTGANVSMMTTGPNTAQFF